jgi:hypothetical protein
VVGLGPQWQRTVEVVVVGAVGVVLVVFAVVVLDAIRRKVRISTSEFVCRL